jgi:hypothetical protein
VSDWLIASRKKYGFRLQAMTTEEKDKGEKMKISQTYGSASAPQEPKSALPGLIERLGLTVRACTLVIGAIGSASAGKAPNVRQAR